MKTFRTDLSVDGIDRLISEIKTYQGKFYTNFMKEIEDLCQAAAEVAQTAFGSAVEMSAVPTATQNDSYVARFAVIAEGRAVGFLEFGAGLLTEEDHPFADDAPFDVREGSYSEEHAMQYYTYGYWYFGGKRYYFVQPRRGLFKASEHVKDNIRSAIRSAVT